MGFKPKRLGMRVFTKFQDALNGGLGVVGRHEVEVAVASGRAEIGHQALIQAVSVHDDPALRGLPEHLGQPHDRHGPGADDVGQHLPGPDGGQLVDIADDEQRRVVGRRFHQRLHQHDVDHRGLVDDQQIAIEGIVGVALEPAGLGIDLQQPMDRLGLDARRFGHALGGAARGGAEQQFHALGRENLQDRVDDRRLADARAAGDHQRLRHQRQPDRGPLTVGELQPLRFSTQGMALSASIHVQGSLPLMMRIKPIGDRLLGPVEARQEHAGGLADLVGDHRALGSFEFEGREDQFLRRFEQFFGQRDQLVRRQSAMTVVHRLGQRVGDPGAQPDHRGLFDAELHGDRVGGLEADAADVAGKPIGVLGHDLDGVGAIGLVDANRPRGADAMAVQEDHDLPDDLLLGPGVRDAFGPDRPDARHLPQPIRLGLDDVEHLLPEGLDQLLGIDRPDAADHAGAEIFLDPLDRTRRRRLEKPRLELLAVRAVVGPFARRGDPLAGGDDGGMADDGHQIAMAARLRPENAEAVLGVMEGHPLDEAGEHLWVDGSGADFMRPPRSPVFCPRATPRMNS